MPEEGEYLFSRTRERWRDFFSVPWFGWYWLLAWMVAALSLYSMWQAVDFFLEKSRFAREGLCTEGTVKKVTKDTVNLWRRPRGLSSHGFSLDVWAPEVRFLTQTGKGGGGVPVSGFPLLVRLFQGRPGDGLLPAGTPGGRPCGGQFHLVAGNPPGLVAHGGAVCRRGGPAVEEGGAEFHRGVAIAPRREPVFRFSPVWIPATR